MYFHMYAHACTIDRYDNNYTTVKCSVIKWCEKEGLIWGSMWGPTPESVNVPLVTVVVIIHVPSSKCQPVNFCVNTIFCDINSAPYLSGLGVESQAEWCRLTNVCSNLCSWLSRSRLSCSKLFASSCVMFNSLLPLIFTMYKTPKNQTNLLFLPIEIVTGIPCIWNEFCLVASYPGYQYLSSNLKFDW